MNGKIFWTFSMSFSLHEWYNESRTLELSSLFVDENGVNIKAERKIEIKTTINMFLMY